MARHKKKTTLFYSKIYSSSTFMINLKDLKLKKSANEYTGLTPILKMMESKICTR